MCGFIGCYLNNNVIIDDNNFYSILKTIAHRGPDNTGFKRYQINNKEILFGHQRLSIQDLNNSGNQPMESDNGRYSLIYNGEIYNNNDLRNQLNKDFHIKWYSNSDTETLLRLLENYEIDFVLNSINGMFAFSLFDRKLNRIIISRDRVGEKPLYITSNRNYLGFASDLNPLKKLPNFNKNISKEALQLFLKLNYIPTPYSIYENSFKLYPGTYLEIRLDNYFFKEHKNFEAFCNDDSIKYREWWSFKKNKTLKISNINDEQVNIKNIENLLSKSVKRQLLSDVPVGAFLSGGVDSSLIVSNMQKFQKTNTYTIGYDFADYDESAAAKKIANILGTNHHEHICTKNDLLDLITELPSAFSEPFADSSQIPTMLISKIASKDMKVMLGGDGGDELFGGYNRYLIANNFWKYLKFIPFILRNNSDKILKYLPKSIIIFLLNFLNTKKYSLNFDLRMIDKVIKKIQFIKDENSYYNSMISQCDFNDTIFNFKIDNLSIKSDYYLDNDDNNFLDNMMYSDFKSYLHDDILCKIDRSSMYYSLETRSPFLDKDIIDYGLNLSSSQKIKNKTSKYLNKKILEKYLPNNLIYKPKKGFALPISRWMKKDLKSWVNDVLSKNQLQKHNLFNYNKINQIKNDHFNDKANNEYLLWSLIQFNQWYDAQE